MDEINDEYYSDFDNWSQTEVNYEYEQYVGVYEKYFREPMSIESLRKLDWWFDTIIFIENLKETQNEQ